MVSDVNVTELERTLEDDDEFRKSFDEDPVAATRKRGMGDIAAQFEEWLANPDEFERELPDTEAHGLGDTLNTKIATRPRLAMLLLTSAVIASQMGWARNGG